VPIKLIDLIARVPAEVEERVRRARDQARPAIQESLRSECRLVLRTPEETARNKLGAQVPIEIAPGYPVALREIAFPDDFDRILVLGRYRREIEQGKSGASGLRGLRNELLKLPSGPGSVSVEDEDLRRTAEWAAALLEELDRHDPLRRILSVADDILGVYEYQAGELLLDEYVANRATIRLYWGVIGLVAEWLGSSVEDLTAVVLTHELAHAYTQLGADIEGRRWPARAFAAAEPAVKEGLAQYYTDRVLRRLHTRWMGSLKAFEAMLPKQAVAYHAHEPWIERSSPEAVRRAMLEIRRWNEGKLEDFERRLYEAADELNP
jgi:hypothetical protein